VRQFLIAVVILITTSLALVQFAHAAQTHVVKRGETLSSIATRHQVSVASLVAVNNLRSRHRIWPGQQLVVPGAEATSPTQVVAPAESSQPVTHLVKPKETLWKIASRYRVSVHAIVAANGLRNPNALKRGQRLVIPGRENLSALPPLRRANSATIPSRGEKWASAVVARAMRFIGVRYVWGGMSPRGFDCSGLLGFVMRAVGVSVPRTTSELFVTGHPVARDQLLVGDAVFFTTWRPGPSHVGIYIGNNQFIHASSGFGRVTVTSMDYPYYKPRYMGARRF